MMATKYKFLRKDRANCPESLDDVEFCYGQIACDYGLANDDTRLCGIEYISVTLNSDGDYPGFTIPRSDLRNLEQ